MKEYLQKRNEEFDKELKKEFFNENGMNAVDFSKQYHKQTIIGLLENMRDKFESQIILDTGRCG